MKMKMLQIISVGFFLREAKRYVQIDGCKSSTTVVDECVYKADDKIHAIFLHV